MKKRLFIVIGLIVVIALGAIYATRTQNQKPDTQSTSSASPDDPTPMTVAEKKKSPPATPAACMVKNESIKQEDEDPIAGALAQEVVSQLIDVPAGTQVDVPIAFLDEANAQGSAIYPEDYGTYNFVAKKDADANGRWKITSFVACKQ